MVRADKIHSSIAMLHQFGDQSVHNVPTNVRANLSSVTAQKTTTKTDQEFEKEEFRHLPADGEAIATEQSYNKQWQYSASSPERRHTQSRLDIDRFLSRTATRR